MTARFCIVGSGVAGGIIAEELLAAGAGRVVMLEAGARQIMRDERIWLDLVTAGRHPFRDAVVSRAEYTSKSDLDYSLESSLLRVRGGSTLHWDGWAMRLKPEDFRLRSARGHGADWPITYEDLEPFYAKAERTLRVAGDATDAGHPPRSGPFPLPAMPYQAADRPFLDGMGLLGWSTQHTCISRNTAEMDGHAPCQTVGTCLYCPVGGRFTGDEIIDRLETRPDFELRLRTTATRILTASKSRVRGVEVVDGNGAKQVVEADYVVVCANAIHTPRLLLSSTGDGWSSGIGNDRDLVGRHLSNHVGATAVSVQRRNPDRLLNELFAIETAISRHFDTAEQPDGKFQIQQSLRHESDPMANAGPLVRLMMKGETKTEIDAAMAGHVYRAVLPMVEHVASPDDRVLLGSSSDAGGLATVDLHFAIGEQAGRTLARARAACEDIVEAMDCSMVTWLDPHVYAHHAGTCRAAAEPSNGVVDADLRVHGVENLFVCGSAVFPSIGAAQPTLTIAALAHRLGGHLSRLGR